MTILLTAVALWLSANFGLPSNHDLPRVALVPAAKINALYFGDKPSAEGMSRAANETGRHEIVSVYDDQSKTIYLPDGWTGSTPAELSVLVHEMVHHFQNAAGMKHECPQEREKLAYEAQDRWLGLFGRDLQTEFQIDPFTLLVNTRCMY